LAPLQSLIAPAPSSAGLPLSTTPPLRFFPLRRLPGIGQPLAPEATSLQVRALAAFLTLSGPFSARRLPALFRAGPVPGVSPFRVPPPAEPCTLVGCRCPPEVGGRRSLRLDLLHEYGLLVMPQPFRKSFEETLLLPPAPLQGFAPCEWPCLRGDCLSLPGDRDPRGLSPLWGIPPPCR
jgi:hypothetical protein